MQVKRYLGLVKTSEQLLRDSLRTVASRHQRDPEISTMATQLAGWSQQHVERLTPFAKHYGSQPTAHPLHLRSALLYGARIGGLGLLEDLEDLLVLASSTRSTWTVLAQAAAELRDVELGQLATESGTDTDRQIAWLKTHVKLVAPQAVTVAPEPMSELKGSLPRRPSVASIPDAVWAPLAGGTLVLLTGVVGIASGYALLLPSLGPSAYLAGEAPALPSSRFLNTIAGHLVALAVGFFAVWLLAANNDPATLTSGELTWARLGAATIAVVLSMMLLIAMHLSHPPAAATALLVALGSLHTPTQALSLVAGVAIIALAGELLRHVRLGSLHHPSAQRPAAAATEKHRDGTIRPVEMTQAHR